MANFEIDGVINLDVELSQFKSKLEEMKTTYNETKTDIEEKKIKSPLANEDTKDSVAQSYDYLFASMKEARSIITSISSMTTSLPQEIQNAMSGLVKGVTQAFGQIDSSFDVVGRKMKKDFNLQGFTNNLRFETTNILSYLRDIQDASRIVTGQGKSGKGMSAANVQALSSHYKQLSSLVDPAMTKLRTKEHEHLRDSEIVSRFMSGAGDHKHIIDYLNKIGITSEKGQREALDFAVKTSSARRFRNSVARQYVDSGMSKQDIPVRVTDMVPDAYKASFLSGGRTVGKPVQKQVEHSRDLELQTYANIKRLITEGNHVAFLGAQNAGLVTLANGRFRFAQRSSVTKDMLDQYGGFVSREGNRAVQGHPQWRRPIDDISYEEAIIGNDSIRKRESIAAMNADVRKDANPIFDENYKRRQGVRFEKGKQARREMPELAIPETINIPRMTIQNTGKTPQLMVKRKIKDSEGYEYSPTLDFGWQKSGVGEKIDDEWISMGRNPILDRLIKLHSGAKFENGSFGYGFDEKNNPKQGAPLVVDVPLEEFLEKDRYGDIKFEGEGHQRMPIAKKGMEKFVNDLYWGKNVSLNYGGENIEYRVVGGKTNNGGSLKLIQSKDYDKLVQQDIERGAIPMLSFFNETDKQTGKLINPETGEVFEDNSAATKAFAKYFDARNKIFSHSIPIEELNGGRKGPKAALVNFEPFYEANKTPQEERFDGGAYMMPQVFSTDFQARMGPAKFLATRANYKKWFIDSGFAYKDKMLEGDDNYHFWMQGMYGASKEQAAKDYEEYRAAYKAYTEEQDLTKKQELAENLKAIRKGKFVDIMDKETNMLIADTAVKNISQLKALTPERYNEVVAAAQNRIKKNGGTTFFDKPVDIAKAKGMVNLTADQSNELFNILADPEFGMGLRAMKDAENYAGIKGFWSPAYMSSVRMTPSLMKKSTENYEKAFAEFQTDEGIIKKLFSGSDMDSVRVRNDPRLLHSDRAIQAKIQSAYSDLEEKQLRGYGYFPGMSQMFLANPNMYSVFNPIGKDLTNKDAQGFAAGIKLDKGTVLASLQKLPNETAEEFEERKKNTLINWTRSPYAPGANFFGSAQASEYAKRYGMTENSASINVADMYALNTGDFDGDFIWAYLADKEEQDFKTLTERRNKETDKARQEREADESLRKQRLKDTGEDKVVTDYKGTDFALAWLRDTSAINEIGLGYKAGQVAYRTKLMDEKSAALVDDFANYVYGAGIDKRKNPDLAIKEATGIIKEATKTRKPIERLTDQILSENDNEDWGKTDIFDYALPAFFDPIGTTILENARIRRSKDAHYGESFKDALHQNIKHRYADKSKEEMALAEWYEGLLASKLTGEYQISSTSQLEEGQNRLKAVQNLARKMVAKNPESEEAKSIQSLIYKAQSVISTERTNGFYELNAEDAKKHYAELHADNPFSKFTTKLDRDASIILYQRALEEEQKEIEAEETARIQKIVSERTGKVATSVKSDDVMARMHAAHMFTGFNWSNAKEFTKGYVRFANGLTWSDLEGNNETTANPVTYNPEAENLARERDKAGLSNRQQVALRILTGETAPSKLDSHAVVGSAAHKYMDTYGLARIEEKTHEEATELAYKAFEDYLLGDKDEQKKEREKAGVSFEKDASGLIVAKSTNKKLVDDAEIDKINTKLRYASRYEGNESSLDQVAEKFYKDLWIKKGNDEQLLMTEGSPFDENGFRIESRTTEGGNGIWLKPTRDGKNVIDFERYKKEPNGEMSRHKAGLYFTPDMIKRNKDTGEITMVDWKSSVTGQQEALFQMSFYAHQLEELGKQYHADNSREDLKWFGQFWDPVQNKSMITKLQAVNILKPDGRSDIGNEERRVLTKQYNASMGDYVSKWVEGGFKNLADAAANGFYGLIPDEIKPVFEGRKMKGERPVLAPDQKEEDFLFPYSEAKKLQGFIDTATAATEGSETAKEVLKGRTGVSDNNGGYIDNDKSYIVAKFMKDQETLEEVRKFANKQDKRLNNKSYNAIDDYTQHINMLKDKFTDEEYKVVEQYVKDPLHVAPDAKKMYGDFSTVQLEALQETSRLADLRSQYVAKMAEHPELTRLDYDSILYGDKDQLSKLYAARAKMQKDTSAIREDFRHRYDQFYNGDMLETDLRYYYKKPDDQREGESDEDYQKRVKAEKKANYKQAKTLAEKARNIQEQLSNKDKTGLLDVVANENTLFQKSWLQEFKTTAAEETSLSSLFNGKSLRENATALRQKALGYELAATEKDSGLLTDVRLALAGQSKELTKSADFLDQAKGTKLEDILNIPETYKKQIAEAMLSGRQLTDEERINKEAYDFLKAYTTANKEMFANPETASETVLSLFDQFVTKRTEQAAGRSDISRAKTLIEGTRIADLYDQAAGVGESYTPLFDKAHEDAIRRREAEEAARKAEEESKKQQQIDAANQQRADELRARLGSHEVTKDNFEYFKDLAREITQDPKTLEALDKLTYKQYDNAGRLKGSFTDAVTMIKEVANNPLSMEMGKYRDSTRPFNEQVWNDMIQERRAPLEAELADLEARGYTADKGKKLLPGQYEYEPIKGLSFDERVELKSLQDRMPNLDKKVADAQALYENQTIQHAQDSLDSFKNDNAQKIEKLTPETQKRLASLKKRIASAGTPAMLDALKGEYQHAIDEDKNVKNVIAAREKVLENSQANKVKLEDAIKERDQAKGRISELQAKQANPVKTANEILTKASEEIKAEGEKIEPEKPVKAIDQVSEEASKAIVQAGKTSTEQERIRQQAVYNEMVNQSSSLETIDKLSALKDKTPEEEALLQRLSRVDTRQGTLDKIRQDALNAGKSNEEADAAVKEHEDRAAALREQERQYEELKLKTAKENALSVSEQRLSDTQFAATEAEFQSKRRYENQRRQSWGGSRSRFINSFLRGQEIKENLEAEERAAEQSATDKQKEIDRLTRERNLYAKGTTEYETKNNGIEAATTDLERYKKAAENAREQMSKFGPGANLMKAGITSINDSMGMLLKRFGRQMFMKAINEAKQFVKQFDKTMTEIQMITLKSDTEMGQVSDSIIGKAKELKVSIAEVSQSAATLYRQGLTDEQVDERLGVISKFSKVSGTKVADATKLITVAMNTGLVSNAMEASDIVTALGDNAATNAQQIEKGIEKAGAAAAADGTTFGQLAAMLTAITSTTQIGGNVAGRTLNTIFGRMNKIGTNELIVDENGNTISGSAVAKLLKKQGIDQYDENGKKRSSFDTLYALSQRWDNMTDAEQQQMANAIAGTRQYSNFSAIMQGMKDGKIDEYMDLIGESSGITDKKFDVYKKSLEASLTDFKNVFDSTINDLVDKGAIKTILGFFKDLTSGIGTLVGSVGGLVTVVALMSALAVAVSAIRGGPKAALATGVMLGASALLVGGTFAIGSAVNSKQEASATSKFSDYISNQSSIYEKQSSSISRFRDLAQNANRTDAETNELLHLGKSLGDYAGASSQVEALSSAINGLGDSASGAMTNITELAENIAKEAEEKQKEQKIQTLINAFSSENGGTRKIIDAMTTEEEDYINSENGLKYNTEQLFSRGVSAFSQIVNANPEAAAQYPEEIMSLSPENFKYQIKAFGHGAENLNDPWGMKGYARTLGNLFEQMSSSDFVDSKLRDISSDDWVDIIHEYANGIGDHESLIDLAVRQLFSMGQNNEQYNGSVGETQKQSFKDSVLDVLQQLGENQPIDEEMLPYVAEGLAQQYFAGITPDENGKYSIPTERDLRAFIYQQFGIMGKNGERKDINSEDFYSRVNSISAQGGYNSFEQNMAESGLEATSKSGYYINTAKQKGEEGYIVSRENALNMSPEEQKNLKAVYRSALYNADYTAYKTGKNTSYAVTADNFARIIRKAKDKSVSEILEDIEGDKNLSAEWDTLYDSDEFKRLMSQTSRNPSTGEYYEPEGFKDELLNFLYSKGTDYGKRQEAFKVKGQRVSAAIAGRKSGDWYESYNAYRDRVDKRYAEYLETYQSERDKEIESIRMKNLTADQTQSEIAAYDRLHPKLSIDEFERARFENAGYISDSTAGYMSDILGAELTQRIRDFSATPQDYMLAEKLASNYEKGFAGLTQQDKIDELKRIQGMSRKEIADYWVKSQSTMKQYGAGFSDLDEYMSLIANEEISDEDLLNNKRYQQLKIGYDNYVRENEVSNVVNRVKGLEQAGVVSSGVASLYEQLVSPQIETRRSAENAITSEYDKLLQAQAASTALGNLTKENWGANSGDYISTIGSYLGLAESEQREYETYDKNKQASLMEEVNKRSDEFFNKMKDLAGLFTDADLSGVTDLNGLLEALGASGEEGAAGVRALIESLTGLTAIKTVDDIFAENAYAIEKADRQTLATMATETLSAGMTIDDLVGEGKTFADADQLAKFLNRNSQVKDIFNRVDADRNRVFAQEDIDALTELTAYGIDNYDSNYMQNYNKLMALRNQNGGFDKNVLQDAFTNDSQLKEFAESVEGLNDVLADQEGTAEGTGEAVKSWLRALQKGKTESLKPFGKETKEVTATTEKFTKDARSAASALGSYSTNLNKIARNNTLIKNAKGKSGAQLGNEQLELFESFGYDKKDIQKKTAEEIADIAQTIQDAIDEAWKNEVAMPVVDLMNSLMADNTMPEEVAIHLNTLVNADGSFDVSAAVAYLEAQGNAAYNSLIATLKAFDGKGGSLTVDLTGDGFVLKATETGNNSTPRGGGGGGGKKKSAAEKLIEKQQRKMEKLQHKQNMRQLKETKWDYLNDYKHLDSNYDNQIKGEKTQKKEHEKNIKQLKKQLKKTKDKDERKKIQQQIEKEEEEARKNENNIFEIKKKKYLTSVDERLTNRAKPLDHKRNMVDIYAQRAELRGNYTEYVKNTKSAMSSNLEKQKMNDQDIATWKKQLAKVEKGSDLWIEIRDKIYEKEEENAQLENDYLQLQIDLFNKRFENIAKILQHNTQTANHNINIADMYSQYYQESGYRAEYEQMLRVKKKNNATVLAENKTALKNAQAALKDAEKEFGKGSDQYFEAQQAVYEYTEAVAQATIEQYGLDRALRESKLEAIGDTYRYATMEIKHTDDALSKFAADALERNDFTAYFKAQNEILKNMPDQIAAAQHEIVGLRYAYKEAINAKAGPAELEAILNQIYEAENELQDLMIDYNKKQRELAKETINYYKEEQDFAASNYEHNQKMLGFLSTKYQSAGELTNYNKSIQADTKYRKERIKTLQEELKLWKDSIDMTEAGSEEEKEIIEQIKKHEESIASENAAIEKNNKLIEENQKKIRQLQKTLEDSVDKEIEEKKKRDKEILAANVSLENTLLDIFKKRLQEEWNLKKKDLDKEKESLSEYKKLINERYNYRKKASQQADKDEELAEYRRQLALIQADPTRTKDAKELQRKIEELEKEQAWTIAEDELNAENERIDDQIQGIDKFVQYNDELLNQILGDANNFATEINSIMAGSLDDILNYLQKTYEAFAKSLPDAQKQMVNSWEETIKKAKDMIDTNYPEIKKALNIYDSKGNLKSYEELSSGDYRDRYVNWMKEYDLDYRKAREEGNKNAMKILEIKYQETFDDFLNSIKNNFSYTPDDHTLRDVESAISDLKNNIYKVELVDLDLIKAAGYAPDVYGLANDGTKSADIYYSDSTPTVSDYSDIGTTYDSGTKNNDKKDDDKKDNKDNDGGSKKKTPTYIGYEYEKYSSTQHKKIDKYSDGSKKTYYLPHNFSGNKCKNCGYIKPAGSTGGGNNNNYVAAYASGGLVDYTGPAWVDGTKTHPEAFLSATDTENIRAMLDMFTYVNNVPLMSYIDPSCFGNTNNVGDINITINQAELKSGADVEKLAKQVGQAFSKELQRNGLNLAGYSFG